MPKLAHGPVSRGAAAMISHNIMAMAKRPLNHKPSVGSAAFKARCLELIDHVKEGRAEYIVTRHGVPVAKLVPVDPEVAESALGSMRGTLLKYDEPFEPVPAAWTLDADPKE